MSIEPEPSSREPGAPLVPEFGSATSLKSLGFWPRYLPESNVMEHVPVMAWYAETVPHSSVIAIGGGVEAGYFSLCQVLELLGGSFDAEAFGRWNNPDGESKVPDHIRWHNDLHYGDFSTIASVMSGVLPLDRLVARAYDIVFFEKEGCHVPDLDLDAVLQRLKDRETLLLANLPRSSKAREEAQESWERHIGSGNMAFVEGRSTLMVGAVGGTFAPTLTEAFSRTPNIFRSLGRRNLRLLGCNDAGEVITPREVRRAGIAYSTTAGTSEQVPVADLGVQIQTVLALAESERQKLVTIYTHQIEALRGEVDSVRRQCELHRRQPGKGSARLAIATASLQARFAEATEALAEERKARFRETAILTRLLEDERADAHEKTSALEDQSAKRYRRMRVLSARYERAASDLETLTEKLDNVVRELAESKEREHEARTDLARIEEGLSQQPDHSGQRLNALLHGIRRFFVRDRE